MDASKEKSLFICRHIDLDDTWSFSFKGNYMVVSYPDHHLQFKCMCVPVCEEDVREK